MIEYRNIRLYNDDSRVTMKAWDGRDDVTVIDDANLIITPSFIDSHIHGAFGHDISDGDTEGVIKIARGFARYGVGAFVPTLMTLPEDRILKSCEAVQNAMDRLKSSEGPHSDIIGLRLEGPMLSPHKTGVQKSDYLAGADEMERIISKAEAEFPGLIKIIDVAPEVCGAMDLVKSYKDKYIFSCGHTACSYEEALEFFDNGGNCVTHMMNAMEPCLARSPGVLGSAFDRKDVYAEVICDGIHIAPSVLRMLFRLYEDRLIVISDSMRGAMMPEGIYDLGGTDVEVRDGRTYYGKGGNLAGSVTNLAEEAVRLCQIGIDPVAVIDSMSMIPAKRLGIDIMFNNAGDIRDFNVMDANLNIVHSISKGWICNS